MRDLGVLVGRRPERAAIVDALDRLATGGPCWLTVAGEPGIGKSRLLAELAATARAREHLVLFGRAAEFEKELPFGVWVDALDEASDELTALDAAGPLAAERYRTHRAVRKLLESLAAQRPVTLVLDDVHWADPASIELLAALLRRPPNAPVLAAVAFRTGRIPDGLDAGFEAAIRNVGGVALQPGPLTAAESAELLGARLPKQRAGRLYRESGGNPFYLQQLARQPEAVPEPPGGDLSDRDVPSAVGAALGAELAALGPSARLLAWGAAVAGDPFDLAEAGAASDLTEPDRLIAIGELVRTGLVRDIDEPLRFRFRHPIVRRATYRSADPAWRTLAHGRLATALAATGAGLSARAHHVSRSAGAGDLAAVELLFAAGRAALASAPEAAIGWFRTALRLVPASAHDQRSAVTAALAEALVAIGQLAEARDHLLDAIALAADPAVSTQLIATCADLELLMGGQGAAESRLRAALTRLPPAAVTETAVLQLGLAMAGLFRAGNAGARCWVDAALGTLRGHGDPMLIATAHAIDAYCGMTSEPATDAAHAKAVDLLDRHADDRSSRRMDALFYVAEAELWAERYELARARLLDSVDLCRATGQGKYLITMMTSLSLAENALGLLPAAAEHAEAAVESARLSDIPAVLAWALWSQAWTSAAAGDLVAAMGQGQEAVARVAGMEHTVLSAAAHAHFAVICQWAGNPDRCLAELAIAGAPDFTVFAIGRRAMWCAAAADAELAMGDRAAAERWVRRGAAFGADPSHPVGAGAVLRARAELLLHDGNTAAAAEHALRAAALAESRGARIEVARSRAVAGRAWAQGGDVVAAVAELTTAEGEFGACGAARLRAAAARELHRVGRTRPAAPAGSAQLDGLTERERMIVALVAAGRSDRAIAAELFLSERAVDGSLQRILGKLGVASRAALEPARG